jgi:hypothetical protein
MMELITAGLLINCLKLSMVNTSRKKAITLSRLDKVELFVEDCKGCGNIKFLIITYIIINRTTLINEDNTLDPDFKLFTNCNP